LIVITPILAIFLLVLSIFLLQNRETIINSTPDKTPVAQMLKDINDRLCKLRLNMILVFKYLA
jgi:hypothetical protein